MRLQDKVAVITGAASGIGKEIAIAFAREGAKIVVADLIQKAADATAAELDPAGRRALGVAMDVALYNYNMFSYLDAKWLGPLIKVVVSEDPMVEKLEKAVRMQPDFNNRGAIRSIFDGRYRFSRYFSPIHFNRPTTYEALVANNELEVYDLQEDPEETRNLAQDGTAKGELMMALNDKLNARIDEEVGDDDGKFLSLIDGYWYPAKV